MTTNTQPSQQAPKAWSDADLSANPHANTDKATKVQSMFGAIAGKYDLNNRLHSFGLDQSWRKRTVKLANLRKDPQGNPLDDVLDVACGTGDLTRAFSAAGARSVIGLDFTPQMLDIARTKPTPKGQPQITYTQGDAMALPYDDNSFDVLSIAFGIRNVTQPLKALAEFARVLRPGGRALILEFDRPPLAPVRWGNTLYTKHIMPLTASLISGDKSGAYKYLPRSVETFMTSPQMVAALQDTGFTNCHAKRMTLGVVACSIGHLPTA